MSNSRVTFDRINKTITLGDIVALPAKTKYPATTPDLLLGKVVSIFQRASQDFVGVIYDIDKVCETHNILQNPARVLGTRKIKYVENDMLERTKGVYCLARKTIVISSKKEETA